MHIHIGYYKWKGDYLHLFYSLDSFRFQQSDDVIEMPASLLFMGTDIKVLTEFVKNKLIGPYHHHKISKGYHYCYRGVNKMELIDSVEKLKIYFKINEDKFNKVKSKIVVDAI